MTERQRRLLLLIDACKQEGRQATINHLMKLSEYAEITVHEDLVAMKALGMVDVDTERRADRMVKWAMLTRKGEERIPRVRIVKEMDEAVTD